MPRVRWAHTIRANMERLRSATLNPEEHDPYQFRRSYRALRGLFAGHVRLDSEDSVLAGACAIYGWMPTMLKSIGESHEAFCDLAERVSSVELARAVERLDALQASDRECLLRHINGSVVGTSKFLHFLSNGTLPIWDSNVARSLDLRSGHEKPDRYIDYAAAVATVLGDKTFQIPDGLQTFMSAEGQVTDARTVEFGLYITGVALRTAKTPTR